MAELWQLGAAERSAAIRTGEASSTQVVLAHLDRNDLDDIRGEVSDGARALLDVVVTGRVHSPSAYMEAIRERARIAGLWRRFQLEHPVIIGPVSTLAPGPAGFVAGGSAAVQRLMTSLVLTESCNLLGLPSVPVPVDVGSARPSGVQVIARRFHEDDCLDVAEVIEQAVGCFTPIDPAW